MRHPLEPIDWRLERADQHLATLDSEWQAFAEQEDRRIVGEFQRETSEYVFSFDGKLPEPRIGLIVGEFAHNLRAALDNLVWQLVLLRGGSPTRSTQFPIEERREWYLQRLRAGALRGVSADDRAAIEAIQPYHLGPGASQANLTRLSWLNNVDKHRFLHVGCVVALRSPIRVSYGAQGEDAGLFPWNPLIVKDVRKILGVDYISSIRSDDRAELMRVRIEASGPDPQMHVDRGATVEIALSDAEHALIIDHLRVIRDQVALVIDAFRPRFDVVTRGR